MQMYADLSKDTLNQNLSCDLWGGFTGPTCFPSFEKWEDGNVLVEEESFAWEQGKSWLMPL